MGSSLLYWLAQCIETCVTLQVEITFVCRTGPEQDFFFLLFFFFFFFPLLVIPVSVPGLRIAVFLALRHTPGSHTDSDDARVKPLVQ